MKNKSNIILLLLLMAVLLFASAACEKKTSWDPGAPSTENGTEESDKQSAEDVDAGDETEEKDETETSSGTLDDVTGDDKDNTEDGTEEEKPSSSSIDTGRNLERIGIYTIDDETLETVSITAMVDAKDGLTVETVVNAVLLALEDHSISVEVAGITTDGNEVTIDIAAKDAVMPFGDAGSSVEEVILDCISYSVFDNFKDLKEIYFTVNGNVYESGHISLPAGEPYLKIE